MGRFNLLPIALAVLSVPVHAREQIAWLAPNEVPYPHNRFGWSTDISGDYIAVGAPFDDTLCDGNCDTGAAYVFRRVGETRVQEVKILNPEPTPYGDTFGWSVAIDANTLLIGRPDKGLMPGPGG